MFTTRDGLPSGLFRIKSGRSTARLFHGNPPLVVSCAPPPGWAPPASPLPLAVAGRRTLVVGGGAGPGRGPPRLFPPAAQARARRFYERAGFAVHGDEWDDPEIGPHVAMWRTV